TILYCDGVNIVQAITGGAVQFGDGTASAPSITFASDTALGLYKAGVDVLGIATAGVQRGTVNASGQITVNTPVSGDAVTVNAASGAYGLTLNGAASVGNSRGLNVLLVAAAGASDVGINIAKPGSTLFQVLGSGAFALGNNGGA